jgi:hypothetical protein
MYANLWVGVLVCPGDGKRQGNHRPVRQYGPLACPGAVCNSRISAYAKCSQALSERQPIFPDRAVDLGNPGGRVSPVPPPLCFFCGHTNPAEAKFCNECGSPLHLKPCKQCDAINDATARICYRCGELHPALVSVADTASMAPAAATAAGSTPRGEHPSLPESVAPSDDVRSPPPVDTPAGARPSTAEAVVVPEPCVLGGDDSPVPSVSQDLTHGVASPDPARATQSRPALRVAAAVLPPVVLLAAVAVSASYAYLHPLQFREWLSATQSLVDRNAGSTLVPATAATTSVPVSPAPPVSVGPAGIAATGPTVPAPPNEAEPDVPTSPDLQDASGATGSDGTNGRPLPNPSPAGVVPPQVAASDPVAPAPAASRATKKTSTGTKATAKKSKKAPAKKSASTPVRPAPSAATSISEASATTRAQ